MDKSAYPTAANLAAILASGALTTSGLDLATAALAGRRAFERDVRRVMLAETGERRFDPPTRTDGILLLGRDLAGAPSAVSYQPEGSAAEALTAGDDYVLEPQSAAADGLPYTRLRFWRKRWREPLPFSLRGSIYITGEWGYGASIPADAWLAMCYHGLAGLYEEIAQAATGGRLGYTDTEVSEQFGVETWARLLTGWESKYRAAVKRYRKHG